MDQWGIARVTLVALPFTRPCITHSGSEASPPSSCRWFASSAAGPSASHLACRRPQPKLQSSKWFPSHCCRAVRIQSAAPHFSRRTSASTLKKTTRKKLEQTALLHAGFGRLGHRKPRSCLQMTRLLQRLRLPFVFRCIFIVPFVRRVCGVCAAFFLFPLCGVCLCVCAACVRRVCGFFLVSFVRCVFVCLCGVY